MWSNHCSFSSSWLRCSLDGWMCFRLFAIFSCIISNIIRQNVSSRHIDTQAHHEISHCVSLLYQIGKRTHVRYPMRRWKMHGMAWNAKYKLCVMVLGAWHTTRDHWLQLNDEIRSYKILPKNYIRKTLHLLLESYCRG